MKRKFAVFDIDGTIARTSLFFQVVEGLIEAGHIPEKYREILSEKQQIYQHRQHPNAFKEYTATMVEVLLANLANLSVDDYRKVAKAVVEKSQKFTYVYTRELAKKLKDEGYFLIALSGSELYAVEEFTKQFDFDVAFGEHYHQKNGRFTGKIDQVFDRKDFYIKQFIEEHNLTLKDSYAVGDSHSDAAMLRLVEHPIAFNPEDSLLAEAKKHGWKIVIERKNVSYTLEPHNGSYILA